jgi:hypothetical protein
MAVKSPDEMADTLETFLERTREGMVKFDALMGRLRTDETFRGLWDRDSAQALREVGIDPEARTELGMAPYERGPECRPCWTPQGNPCHCRRFEQEHARWGDCAELMRRGGHANPAALRYQACNRRSRPSHR